MKPPRPLFFSCLVLLLLQGQGLAQPSGSVTQGKGVTSIADLLPSCPSNHKTPLGTIQSSDGKTWNVPANNAWQSGPKLPDLYNTCTGIIPKNLSELDLGKLPVTVLDPEGEVITGFLFSDNYVELFINDSLIGVDPIPFTPFNSCVVKFKVSQPYTIAVRLVDWEENLGLGSEINNGNNFHPGDGGFIAQFSDGTVTDASWKVQSFYIAPIQNLNDVQELPDGTHSTKNATTTPTCDANCYGVHYPAPADWADAGFNDSGWPFASLYTAAQVTNQPAYTNFANTAWPNAKFIWSSNLILDNVVLARKKVGLTTTSAMALHYGWNVWNPFADKIRIRSESDAETVSATLADLYGRILYAWNGLTFTARETQEFQVRPDLPQGMYILHIRNTDSQSSYPLFHVQP